MSSPLRVGHEACVACGRSISKANVGLGLDFEVKTSGEVVCQCCLGEMWQGYSGIVHGGILATLLDAAMTHSLFAKGIVAKTCALEVRYVHSVKIGEPLELHGECSQSRGRLHHTHAEILANGVVVAHAKAKFVE